MEVETKRQGDTLIAMTDGRVDGANAREFQTALDAAIDDNEFSVVLDMEQLSYISSAGLRVILLTAKALQGRHRKFAICALSESIREVFEISGFDKIISIHASRSDALAAFNNRPTPDLSSIREVFEISGFDKIISIHASRSDALAAFNN